MTRETMAHNTSAYVNAPYRIKVHWLEVCNCDPGCNCNFGGFPDHGNCEAMDGMQIIEGHYGDVELAGLKAVIACAWPKAIHEGHGQLVLFVDESARPEQADVLGMIFSGKAGGLPWDVLAGTIESFEGPIRKPIEMTIDGRRSSFRIPGVLEAALTPLKNPVTGAENEVHIVFPKGGLIWNQSEAATTETMHITHGSLSFKHPKQSAFYAVTEWTNQAKR
jgi:hypothetical protein